MGLRQSLANWILRGANPAQVYSDTSNFTGFLQTPTSPAPDAGPLVENEQISAIAARCVDSISEDAASVPMRLFDVGGTEPRLIRDHAAVTLFRHINPVDTPTLFFQSLYADLLTEGNFFAFLDRGPDGIPINMLRLPPEQVTVVPNAQKIIGGYKWKPPGSTEGESYTPDQIMHVRTRNPGSAYRGMGKMVRLRDQILLDRAMRQWKLAQFQNGVPTTVIVYVQRMIGASEEEWERFQDEFWSRLKGPKNAGKPIFLRSGDMKMEKLDRPSEEELAFIGTLKYLRNEFAMLFGVPPSRLSDYSESFRANASEQGRTYWQDTIMSWHRLVLDYLNSTFLPRWFPDVAAGRKLAFNYDYSQIRALALSQRDQAQLNEILVRNALRTPNQAAVSMGDPAHDDPKADDLYMNGKPLGESGTAPAPGQPSMPGGIDSGTGEDDEAQEDAGRTLVGSGPSTNGRR